MSPCWLGARRGFRQLHGEASFVNWIGETSFVNCHAIKSHRRNFSGRFCPYLPIPTPYHSDCSLSRYSFFLSVYNITTCMAARHVRGRSRECWRGLRRARGCDLGRRPTCPCACAGIEMASCARQHASAMTPLTPMAWMRLASLASARSELVARGEDVGFDCSNSSRV